MLKTLPGAQKSAQRASNKNLLSLKFQKSVFLADFETYRFRPKKCPEHCRAPKKQELFQKNRFSELM
jgi:hypothetical protein